MLYDCSNKEFVGKEFDAEVRITVIVTIVWFLLCSRVRTIPSRFSRPGFCSEWNAWTHMIFGTCVVPASHPEEVQLQKHELHKQLHKHMELPCVYVIVYVTHEFKVP